MFSYKNVLFFCSLKTKVDQARHSSWWFYEKTNNKPQKLQLSIKLPSQNLIYQREHRHCQVPETSKPKIHMISLEYRSFTTGYYFRIRCGRIGPVKIPPFPARLENYIWSSTIKVDKLSWVDSADHSGVFCAQRWGLKTSSAARLIWASKLPGHQQWANWRHRKSMKTHKHTQREKVAGFWGIQYVSNIKNRSRCPSAWRQTKQRYISTAWTRRKRVAAACMFNWEH